MIRFGTLTIKFLMLATAILMSGRILAAEPTPENRFTYETAQLRLRLSPRTPEQIAAFYEGRGFPKDALEVLKKECFLGVGMLNKGQDTIWLELDSWKLKRGDTLLSRYQQQDWKQRWDSVHLSAAHQTTFRWTQMPEVRDLQPAEPVGGNISMPYSDQPFDVILHFATGQDKQGTPLTITFSDVRCLRNPAP